MLKEPGLKVFHLSRSYIRKHAWRSVPDAPFKREGGESLERSSIFFFAISMDSTI
jgi:hypothetical protein